MYLILIFITEHFVNKFKFPFSFTYIVCIVHMVVII